MTRRAAALVLSLSLGGCGGDPAPGDSDVTGADVADATGDVTVDLGTDGDAGVDPSADAPDVSEVDVPDEEASDISDAGDAEDEESGTGADTDADPTDAPETSPDVRPDTAPPGCGDGVVGPGEECDDGNLDDSDVCLSDCTLARCGDAIVNRTFGRESFTSPRVTDPGGNEGFVCDDGATCPAGSLPAACDVGDDPEAPEHGICQALGFEYAESVIWGGGSGATSAPMLHALNWECFAFFCEAGPFLDTADNCGPGEMLSEIECAGIVGEECDDGLGNAETADACRPDCTLPRCGDAIVDSDEECDDANRVDDDGCSNGCLLPQCGDGVVNGDEECDDGNADDTDLCRNSCVRPRCGDGLVSSFVDTQVISSPIVTNPGGVTGHVCDDGGTCQGSTCDVTLNGGAPEHGICQTLGFDRALSVRWGGGAGESDSAMPHAYNWTCSSYVCGASTNTFASDNCSASEMLNTITCNTNRVEECDLGADNSDTPGAACRTTCRFPYCGDGVLDADRGEECDDGNSVPDDGCSNLCRTPRCGDGTRQGDEQCDDGNESDVDGCRLDCTLQVCGDGWLADAEECDDGEANSEEPDAPCRPDCLVARCGDGVTDTGEDCDDGNTDSRDDCTTLCQWPACGDGFRQRSYGEECDDGNAEDGDGCSSVCVREGGAAGAVVFIGHDLFASNESVDRLVGNAVIGLTGATSVRVLGLDAFADRTPTGEAANTDTAIRAFATASAVSVTIDRLSTAVDLPSRLSSYDVLVIYEPESSGATLRTFADAWRAPLAEFLDGGGIVVGLDFGSNVFPFFDAAGLMPLSGGGTGSSGVSLSVVEPDLALADGLPATYSATNGTGWVTVSDPDLVDVVVRDPSGRAVVAYRAW
ncbi:MAG: DUF4215 domain-containing protein [Myxococcales bacterium]|nr:DUF4215 domain-containing protein [Myxococcales bacterium]